MIGCYMPLSEFVSFPGNDKAHFLKIVLATP
jgi:hypothetical protein